MKVNIKKKVSLAAKAGAQPARFLGALLFFVLLAFQTRAAGEAPREEITVVLSMPKLGSTEMLALIEGEALYLPVKEVFHFLHINYAASPGMETISGFFIEQQNKYAINKALNQITYKGKLYPLQEGDLVKTETALYLKLEHFQKIFELGFTFHFRSLTVKLETKLELPVFRERKLEQMRNNLKKLKGEVKPDTVIARRYPVFQLGMADWSVTAMQQLQAQSNTRLNLKLGAMIAGGEATASLVLNSNTPFNERQQFYQWRFVNNSNAFVKQVTAGKIATSSTATIMAPLVGIHLTNTPTTYRKSFGAYTLSNRTEPDWMVELYVNNVLVDYVKSDASGFYTFNVPLVYGSSAVRLRFYGPSGEERSTEQSFSIPFQFLPHNVLEYSVRAGVLQDTAKSRFARASLSYGLGQRITVGGGAEYLSSISTGAAMPYVNATLRLPSNILFYTEHMYGVRSSGVLSYRNTSNLQLELQYTKYAPGQKAINRNFLDERKLTASLPIRIHKSSLLSRLSLNQNTTPLMAKELLSATKYSDIPKTKITSSELMFSGNLARLSFNTATTALFRDAQHTALTNTVSVGCRFPAGVVVRPQVQFNLLSGGINYLILAAEKRVLKKGYATLSYQKSFGVYTNNTVSLGLRWDFSFARTAFSAVTNNKSIQFIQSASGSLMYDPAESYVHATVGSGVGRGGITVKPFLDINCNGKRDGNEPDLGGLKFRINGGRIVKNNLAAYRVINLEPYQTYMIQVDGSSFGNIAWQIKNKNISVTVEPNVFTSIEVPVAVMGEASGMVYLQSRNHQLGLSRIRVSFFDSSSNLVAHTLSEGDGYFSYLGLPPGAYTARLDTAQLANLNMTASPEKISFRIAGSEEGVVADGFVFTLRSLAEDAEDRRASSPAPMADNKIKQSAQGERKQGAVTVNEAAMKNEVLPHEKGINPGKNSQKELKRQPQDSLQAKLSVNSSGAPADAQAKTGSEKRAEGRLGNVNRPVSKPAVIHNKTKPQDILRLPADAKTAALETKGLEIPAPADKQADKNGIEKKKALNTQPGYKNKLDGKRNKTASNRVMPRKELKPVSVKQKNRRSLGPDNNSKTTEKPLTQQQQLAAQKQQLFKKHQQLTQKLTELLHERQRLVEAQKGLIREIYLLKMAALKKKAAHK